MYSYRFHSRHVHTFSSPLPDIISRSHSGESLITGANTFSTHPNFSITQLLVRGALEIHCVSVRRRPAGSRSLPSGPKLICCGQIVFSGVNASCCLDAALPDVRHLYLSQQPQTSAGLTAGGERSLPGNFTPTLPHVFLPLASFLHASFMGCFFKLLNPHFAYQNMEAKCMCIPGMGGGALSCLFFRSSGPFQRKKKVINTGCV